jgi:hypothetical protein
MGDEKEGSIVKQSPLQLTFVDRPEVSETFADAVRTVGFDGQTMRIEFCITRMDEPKPPNPPTARQYPCCSLVLSANAGVDLFNRLQQIMSALEQTGAIKRNMPTPPTIQ